MATISKITNVFIRNFDKTLVLRPQNHVQVLSSACMSQYPKYFVEPTYRKDQLNSLYESGEVLKKIHVPCRAPLSDQTSSLFFDTTSWKFINHIMRKGKKLVARELLEKAFEQIKRSQVEKYHSLPPEKQADFEIKEPSLLLKEALANIKPIMVLTPIKRGGARYQVPVPISETQSMVLAYKWLIEAAKDKDKKMRFHAKLAFEIMEAAKNTGRVVKKKLDLHKQCEANRAYAHYRWG